MSWTKRLVKWQANPVFLSSYSVHAFAAKNEPIVILVNNY